MALVKETKNVPLLDKDCISEPMSSNPAIVPGRWVVVMDGSGLRALAARVLISGTAALKQKQQVVVRSLVYISSFYGVFFS